MIINYRCDHIVQTHADNDDSVTYLRITNDMRVGLLKLLGQISRDNQLASGLTIEEITALDIFFTQLEQA